MTSQTDTDAMNWDDNGQGPWEIVLPQELCDRIQAQALTRKGQLNQLGQLGLQQWLSEEMQCSAALWPDRSEHLSPWVKGAALQLAEHRLVVVPVDAIDEEEICVDQEWVDIPSWRGDYYVVVQMRALDTSTPEDFNGFSILGYTTHQLLKQDGVYDAFDRTYCLDTDDLLSWDAFALTYATYSHEQTQSEVAALSPLSSAQAEQLIQRLAQPQELMPRLEIPFVQWGALLENTQWREQLYQARYGQAAAAQTPTATNLSDWLRGMVDRGQQAMNEALDAVVNPGIGGAIAVRGEDMSSQEQASDQNWQTDQNWQSLEAILPLHQREALQVNTENDGAEDEILYRAKRLSAEELAGVVFVLGLRPLSSEIQIILRLIPTAEQRSNQSINQPEQVTTLQMRLLDDAGSEIGQASATATEQIQMRFRGSPGEAFQVEISGPTQQVTESFVL